MKLHLGLDIGSTTIKLVALDQDFNIVYKTYRRHFSDVEKGLKDIVTDCYGRFPDAEITIMVTGSGGLSVHKWLDIPFIQEVIASSKSISTFIPETDVVIELGGEDAKIIYFGSNMEQRMNSICAGGTGAFIDQMASLIGTDAEGLNNYSKNHKTIYSIASRCGVFAKTDIQALLNQGVSKEDIAASIFQSVVNQTISTLACGRKIQGKVAFLGGPLYFLSELRERYIETLELGEGDVIFPEDSQLFVAIGAAVSSTDCESLSFKELKKRLFTLEKMEDMTIKSIDPLFQSEAELEAFRERHRGDSPIKYGDLENYRGDKFLGIDAGSTTTKAVVLDPDGVILYSYYGNNQGKPLEVSLNIIRDIYSRMPEGEKITYSATTGYGEDFIKAGLGLDLGEVETIAHYEGARYFNPKVDLILDIGGQDMKCIKIKDEAIESILLNEACSSGCGSFLETFAKTLGMDVESFVEAGLLAKEPVDLGSRCTVFMNSKVKQAQKEGKTVGDISAGLSYSVIKNTLQKVIKIRDPKELGENIVVQGGTFYGDGVLRSFELLTGKEVIRPEISGLMGSMGIALIARNRYRGQESTIIKKDQIDNFSYETKKTRCGKCSNNCLLTINNFKDGETFIVGNRCERGVGLKDTGASSINLFDYKYKRTFDYEALPREEAKYVVGIPRILNTYENFPFWASFFKELGFRVELSDHSTRTTYERGLESIPSETACFPAKISHGHIMDLLSRDIDFIFHPSVFYERQEEESLDNHINCPVVIGYSEVLKNNIDEVDKGIPYLNPFINFDSKKNLKKRLFDCLKAYGPSRREVDRAVEIAYEEESRVREDIRKKGEETISYLRENKLKGIVLAGRPYHLDPAINHGIPELINSLGLAVLTEDSICHLGESTDLRVLNQWVYHSRLYKAATYVRDSEELELIQLNSFGCGLDAVTTDQVEEILHQGNKLYTVLKIDEISNLGAAKIRVRSLVAALEDRPKSEPSQEEPKKPVVFTKEMRKEHTILVPQMSPVHFSILEEALKSCGYNLEFLPSVDKNCIDEGLKYVNNDACYPSIITIGQIMAAIKSGRYDLDRLTVMMSQTGGACRASNYTGFIRKALKDSGYDGIPVLSVSAQGIESHPGFDYSLEMARKGVMAILYGDLLSRLVLRTRPYELEEGSVNRLYETWDRKLRQDIRLGSKKDFKANVRAMVEDFDRIGIREDIRYPRVGIVGEILIKYHPVGNNNLIDIIEAEGAEAVISDLADFLNYCCYNSTIKYKYLSKSIVPKLGGDLALSYIESYRKYLREALGESKRFDPMGDFEDLVEKGSSVVSLANQYGEGWLLTAEMIELVESGVENIICVQPFGCLPNHITGKGMIKPIRERYSGANIIPIDYDPGASEVNQLNRIKLMLSASKIN